MNIQHSTFNIQRGADWRARALNFGRWLLAVEGSLLILLVRLYRLTLSPAQTFLFGPNAGCRFTPTCSQYAIDALQVHGPLRGSWLAAKRICRCHPWGECGHDPVPTKFNNQGTKQQRLLCSSVPLLSVRSSRLRHR